jgi:hypothetical protein
MNRSCSLCNGTHKLEIASTAFAFHGLSVPSTWRHDVDPVSVLDGFCQRPPYYVALSRTDTERWDYFLYFAGKGQAKPEVEVRELWQALRAPGGCTGANGCSKDPLSGQSMIVVAALPTGQVSHHRSRPWSGRR